jgi:hypothetical protein
VGLSGLEAPGVPTGNSASPDTSSHSNVRVGTNGWQLNRGTPDSFGARDLATLPTPGSPGSGRPDLIQDPAWSHQPIRLVLPPQNLDKHMREEIFAERARAIGLEPNRSSFKGTMASLDDRGARHVSWIARVFGKNAKSTDVTTPPIKSELRVCHGKECKAGSIPPKPCAGSNCPKPSPSTKAICGSGFRGNKWILPALGLPRELFLPICGQFSGSLPSPLGFGRFELLLADFGGAKTSESTARSNPARTDCGLFG